MVDPISFFCAAEQLLSVEDKEKAPVTTTCSSNSFVEQKQKAFLKLIPTISIDEDVGLREDSCRTWVRRPTLLSVASSCISENSSMYVFDDSAIYPTTVKKDLTTRVYRTIFSIDKNHFVSSRIQRLVSAFTDRAKALKDRIAQPPTPSTDSSDHGTFTRYIFHAIFPVSDELVFFSFFIFQREAAQRPILHR